MKNNYNEHYEAIKEAYKMVLIIKDLFYCNTDHSRSRENEAHFNLGVLGNYLFAFIKDEDKENEED